MFTIHTLGGPQEVLYVTESSFYALAFKSRKPEAKKLWKWVTSEVLPYENPARLPIAVVDDASRAGNRAGIGEDRSMLARQARNPDGLSGRKFVTSR